MRTYDKLIATIFSGQRNGGLRSSFGLVMATGARVRHGASAAPQDTA